MGEKRRVALTINGKRYEDEVEVRVTLADFIRGQLGLTGTHLGCEHGVCGACTILFDGMSRALLPHARGAGRRPRASYRRRNCPLARRIASVATGFSRAPWAAMRLLHAGHSHHADRVLARQSRSHREGSADRALRQSLPLHRISEYCHGDTGRCTKAQGRSGAEMANRRIAGTVRIYALI